MPLPLFALLLAQAAPAPVPTAEANRLGLQLATSGVLANALAVMSRQQTEELVAAHPELTDAEKATLRALAEDTAKTLFARLMTVEGHAYAAALSVDDLRALVAAADSPAARNLRAARPQVIMATMREIGSIDFKGETFAAFCAKTGKACPAKP